LYPRGSAESAFLRVPFPGSMLLDIVAQQHALVSKVQLAVGEDRVGPGASAAAVGLVEAPQLDVALRVGLDQVDPAALVAVVQPAVGVGDRALAGGAAAPRHPAALELQ